MKRTTQIILLLTITGTFAGCSSCYDGIVDCEIKCRNKIIAQKAWNEWSWCYEELDEPYHFAKGFKAGYLDILNGGKGCQPTLPAKCYWKPCYQGPDGQCKVNGWFNGFSHGALAAQQDGYGNLSQIPISPTCSLNLRTANTPSQSNAFPSADQYPVAQPGTSLPSAPTNDLRIPGDNGNIDQAVPLRPYE